MKIALIGYRDWAIKIYDSISREFSQFSYYKVYSQEEFSEEKLDSFDPDLILFYGWSRIIPPRIVSKYKCLMLHPSPLPKYRGGSPIQNQIIRGETESAVTVFIMDEGIDTGDIIGQKKMSLLGDIPDIFDRMSRIGLEITRDFLLGNYKVVKQDNSESTSFKRRQPRQSEITFEELAESTGTYLYNKIRMLTGPYPSAYIKTSDGKKILLKNVEIID